MSDNETNEENTDDQILNCQIDKIKNKAIVRNTAMQKALMIDQRSISLNFNKNSDCSSWWKHQEMIENNVEEVFPYLIENFDKEFPGRPPLHIVCANYESLHPSLVEMLLTKPDILINEKDNMGQTPLHIACDSDYYEHNTGKNYVWRLVEILIEALSSNRSIFINEKDNSGRTPLHIACANRNCSVVEILLKTPNILINLEDNEGKTPIQLINENDNLGRTPLHIACAKGDYRYLQIILKIPEIWVNLKDCKEKTVIAWLNEKDNLGRTPLHHACASGNDSTVEILLKTPEILVNLKDNEGKTPIMLAADQHLPHIVQLMFEDPRVDHDGVAKRESGLRKRDCVKSFAKRQLAKMT